MDGGQLREVFAGSSAELKRAPQQCAQLGGADLRVPRECPPVVPPFGIVEGGRLHGIYSPFFALASVGPFQLFGYRGLLLLPLLAALLMLLGLARLAGQLGLGACAQGWVVVIAGLATPIWFYAVVFWEHGPAACCLVWSLVAAIQYRNTGRYAALVRAACVRRWQSASETSCICFFRF